MGNCSFFFLSPPKKWRHCISPFFLVTTAHLVGIDSFNVAPKKHGIFSSEKFRGDFMTKAGLAGPQDMDFYVSKWKFPPKKNSMNFKFKTFLETISTNWCLDTLGSKNHGIFIVGFRTPFHPNRDGQQKIPRFTCAMRWFFHAHRIHGTGIFTYMDGWFLW